MLEPTDCEVSQTCLWSLSRLAARMAEPLAMLIRPRQVAQTAAESKAFKVQDGSVSLLVVDLMEATDGAIDMRANVWRRVDPVEPRQSALKRLDDFIHHASVCLATPRLRHEAILRAERSLPPVFAAGNRALGPNQIIRETVPLLRSSGIHSSERCLERKSRRELSAYRLR